MPRKSAQPQDLSSGNEGGPGQLSLGLLSSMEPLEQALAEGALLLRGFASSSAKQLLDDLVQVIRDAPLRHMITPGGLRMSVAMTSCGSFGWVSDRAGYRYESHDPATGRPWPSLPESFMRLANNAARQAGFADFVPDSCLINRYEPGTKLSLHKDEDERDFSAPIVSVSLGIPATFLFGGLRRGDPTTRVPLSHGDVVVWGGPARLRYHGILSIKPARHPLVGKYRFNLTFRLAR